MMNFTGVLLGYEKNRPLTDAERENQLRQKERLELPLSDDLCVIKLNSTFMETVDRYYAWRGTLTMLMGGAAALCGVGYMGFVWTTVTRWGRPDENPQHAMLFLLVTGIMLFSGAGVYAWYALKETFTFTHFPIRLNRKTRKVHVFRPGRPGRPILTADWDKLFVTLTPCPMGRGNRDWNILAHVMADDGETVLDTFAFSFVRDVGELDVLRGNWEFLRRYMEDGPEQAWRLVHVCMPIAEHRESLRFSFDRLHVHFMGVGLWVWYPLLPFWLLCVVGRIVSMWTSKVPVWPEHIQAQCRIEADDPYVKDESTNPKEGIYSI
ncbi:hypothetical protein LC55x_3998 [Lysobacter capsici]|uniref:DUF6708 domain-containing protein n=1 Tax=Lysobacter capsici TaxID=435897 RepID=UPI0007164A9E|nr:DUF6708 domain-containing protein [Lysobacter capsici]ALN87249.1 hypothetical protein LC55x_3998 [Lysobacter capsici]